MLPSPFDRKIPFQAQVEKLVSGGQGLVRVGGRVILVAGVLPQEQIELVCTKTKKGYYLGQLVRILEPSPFRVVPRCAFYGRCGGCDFMHAHYDFQHRIKQLIVQESFKRIAKKNIRLPTIHIDQEWGYRHRLQLHKEGNLIGFKARSGTNIVKVNHCPVSAQGFTDLWQNPQILLDHPSPRITVFTPNDPQAGFFVQGTADLISVTLLEKPLVFSLEGFFQANLRLLPTLITSLLDFLTPCSQVKGPSHALDLFCGCGLFGAFLADHFSQVTAIESSPHAIKAAKINLPGPEHHLIELSLEKWISKQTSSVDDFSAVVVDPPRKGLSQSALKFLSVLKARRLAYVSCNPDTMARDTSVLEKAGWQMTGLELFDFYPQTSHIEALGCFEKTSLP